MITAEEIEKATALGRLALEAVGLAVEGVEAAEKALAHTKAALADARSQLTSYQTKLADQRSAADAALDAKFDGGDRGG